MFEKPSQSRRAFLRRSGQLALSGTALPFALNLAAMCDAAAFNAPGDYKALVCVFFHGGNDYGNTVIPYDDANYRAYNNIRSGRTGNGVDAAGVALAFNTLGATVLDPAPADIPKDLLGASRVFALHPQMVGLKDLFNAGQMAVQLNVGPLVEPLTRAEYENRTKRRPPQLFSHDDQTTQWQAPSTIVEKYGWGGGAGDLVLDNAVNTGTSSLFTCLSVDGNAVMLSGKKTLQYRVDRNSGAILINPANSPYGNASVGRAIDALIQKTGSAHKLENEYNAMTARALNAEDSITRALTAAPVSGLGVTFPGDDLGRQLQMVARLIKGRAELGNPKRQVFFVGIGGFDLHENLIAQHPGLMGRVSAAMTAFYNATDKMTLASNVTSFTASDFGRTLALNGTGADHGWGSHHFVVGGAVNGKKFYGVPPPVSASNDRTTTSGSSPYKPENQWHVGEGRLLPTTSVDQYAGTLAKWFGVDDAELRTVFPNIENFVGLKNGITYSKDMGFMKA